MTIPKLFQSILRSDEKPAATAKFHIQGMNCASCVTRVEKAIRQVPGIASVKVDLATGLAAIGYEPASVSPKQTRQAILAAGYKADEAK